MTCKPLPLNPVEDLLTTAAQWQDEGKDVALATVIETWGSSPRQAGSMMIVDADMRMLGSVSGGCVEGAVVQEALETMQDGRARTLEFGVGDEQAWQVGLACGGTIRVYVQRLGETPPSNMTGGGMKRSLLDELNRARDAKRTVVLLTELDSGAQELLYPLEEAPQGKEGHPLHGATLKAVREDKSFIEEGDAGRTFIQVFNPPLRMVIVGAVHIAQSLAPMARLAGYEPILVDPRRAFGSAERFPDTTILNGWPDEILDELGLDHRTAVVVLTHDPKLDDPAITAALKSPAFYIGALGSKRTHTKRLDRLKDLPGIERVEGPIGLAIGAKSPAEIAVSILASVTASLRQGKEGVV